MNVVTAEQLPFFVYGTLRPGCSNYTRHFCGFTTDERCAVAYNYRLLSSGIYPYAVRASGETVTGSLLTVSPVHYPKLMQALDRLEGFHPSQPADSHYVRQAVAVHLKQAPGRPPATETAWMYLAGPTVNISNLHCLSGGDWLANQPNHLRATRIGM